MSALNAAMEALNLAKELSSITQAKAIFGSVSVTLSIYDQGKLPSGSLSADRRLKCTQGAMINHTDYVELGLACADVCTALDRGLDGLSTV